MSRPDRQEFVSRVERTIQLLQGSGLSEMHLCWGVLVALDQGLPLKDHVVLRFARQREAMETDRAREAWETAVRRCRTAVSKATMRNWIEPVELVGEESGLLVLAAPTRIRDWLERHYLGLLSEAVRLTDEFAGVRFATVTLPVPMREVYAR